VVRVFDRRWPDPWPTSGLVAPFVIDDYTRYRLLNGLDDISITLGHDEDIKRFEESRPAFKPVTQ